ncbi:MAG: 2-oxoacid:acceptor oxidoreductase subunit alpha, partial [Betaproteobacteria bacterium]
FSEQFKGKEALLQSNIKALKLGRDYAFEHLTCPLGLRVKRANNVGNKVFLDGNSAAALGAVYGGASVCAWYPITPSSSVAEAFIKYCQKYRVDSATGKARYAIIQGEDELSSIGIAIGAGWNGARSFTATSGPGISLMTEFIGLAYFAEIPVVLINVQRGGPSTGMPTRTQQSDVLSCAYASHGDTKHVLLFPEDPKECFEMCAQALDLAERLQTPIFVMTDLDIGMNTRLCDPLEWDDTKGYDRGKVMTYEALEAGADFGRYNDIDGDGITYRTYPGTHPHHGAYFTRGTTKDRYARYSEAGPDYIENVTRLLRKFESAKKIVPAPKLLPAAHPTKLGALFYGSTSPAMIEALDLLAAQGIAVDALRVRAFPFADEIDRFITEHTGVFVIEQNRDAQLKSLLVNEGQINPERLISVLHFDGTPITARFIVDEISHHVAAHTVVAFKKVVS